jgi:hypothetical protein
MQSGKNEKQNTTDSKNDGAKSNGHARSSLNSWTGVTANAVHMAKQIRRAPLPSRP